MPHPGQELHGPDGMRLRLVAIDPDRLEMDASYSGAAPMPPEHLHPRQSERFEVLEGAMRTIIGGVERRYVEGETFEVPAGTSHQMAADGPARMKWEVRPALRTAEFFERLYGGGITDFAEFLSEFSEEFRLAGR